jgi:protein-tyrosine-phosphatase
MARAFFNVGANGLGRAESAGTEPADGVNPTVVEVMKEAGIDISESKPKLLTQEMIDSADRVFTMGCSIEESCPLLFVDAEDWGLEDPAGKPVETIRRIRDEIRDRVEQLLKETRSS